MAVTGLKDVFRAMTKVAEQEINKLFNRLKYPVIEMTRNTIKKNLKNHHTYQRISDGFYNDNFGFDDDSSDRRLIVIVDKLIESLDVHYEKVVNLITLTAIINYDELYKLHEANVLNDSRRAQKGEAEGVLPWLKWILEEGGKVVIAGYHMKLGNYRGKDFSRSEAAIMVEKGSWSVPQSIQGTISDNWITQSFDQSEAELSPAIKRLIIFEMGKI